MKKLLFTNMLIVVVATLMAQTKILPPVLVAPTNGNTNQIPDVLLDWYPSAGIGVVSYEVQIDTNDTFSDPLVYSASVSSQKTYELLFGTVYYWRVRSVDSQGTSDWSEVFSFTTFSQVDLWRPNDASVDITPKVKLIWSAKKAGASITGITHYDYQVSYDSEFTNISIEGSHPYGAHPADTSHYWVWANLLRFDTTYYWRVRARHAQDMSDWSAVRSFNTLNFVTLNEPANNATNQMLNVTLKWTAVVGAFDYAYELCTDPTFSVPCLSLAGTNSANPQGLMFGTTYYWRVRASHTLDTSDWCPSWSFTTINTVFPTTPANGSYVDNVYPTLAWQPVTGVTGFIIHLDESEGFDVNPQVFITGAVNSYKILTALHMDKSYFWRIRAFEDGDTTNWSATWNFTVGVAPQDVRELLSANTINIYPNPAKESLNLKVMNPAITSLEVKLTNLLGQVVFNDFLAFDQVYTTRIIPVGDLEKGLYILQMKFGNEIYSRKVVIE